MARALLAVVVAAAVTAAAGRSSAQQLPRVAVGPFTGARASVARDAVAAVLGEHAGEVELVPEFDYAAVARRLGVEGLAGDEDVARVARELRLDEVIVGEVASRGRTNVLRLRVVRGRDGVTLGTASWEFERPSDLDVIRGEIWDQLRGYLRPDASATTAARGAGQGRGPSPGGEGGGAPAAVGPSTPGLGFLDTTLGLAAAMRYWRIPVLGELSPRGYENSGYPELRVEAAGLYRWAHERAGVGAAASLAVPLALASRATDGMGNPVDLRSSALEVTGSVVAAYRAVAGGGARVQLGAFYHSFSVDTAMLPREQRLAPASYLGLRAAVEGVLPLAAGPSYEIGLLFGTELRVAAVGTELREAFGENPSTTFGLGGTAGAQVRVDGLLPGLAFRLAGEMLRYRTSFAGRADVGPGSDSVDDYVRVLFGASYALGSSLPSRARASDEAAARARTDEPAPEPATPPAATPAPAPQPTRDPFALQ
jgi:hypothetical protein